VPTLIPRFDRIDARISGWMARHGIRTLRVSLGLIFLWFGALKFFPGVSPAEGLAERTIATLTGGVVPAHAALLALAAWETAIGLGATVRGGRMVSEVVDPSDVPPSGPTSGGRARHWRVAQGTPSGEARSGRTIRG